PTEFSRAAILHAVTVHIVLNDEALLLAEKESFRNCLVIMRPKTVSKDLPSRAQVRAHIDKEFKDHINAI
ncbi:hypothetical protein SISNIDRAFT_402254, partial [Sistotremastrum niveocremeum HHB9708]